MMASADDEWAKARQARNQLAAQVLDHPNVSLVDVGEERAGARLTLVLRVHLRQESASGPEIPNDVNGIPVRVLYGDYRPEH